MDDLIEALKARISSPVLGWFSLAVLALNWKAFFFLVVQDSNVLGRIQYFEANTSVDTLTLWPLLLAVTFAALYPWLIFLLGWLTTKPIELKEKLVAESEHKLILEKKRLESARAALFADLEVELIERAKRDQKVEELDNEELKSKLKADLDKLRAESDSLKRENPGSSSFERHKELMGIAADYRARAEGAGYDDRESFLERARELEEEAYSLIKPSGPPF